jgi:hypothetical protein
MYVSDWDIRDFNRALTHNGPDRRHPEPRSDLSGSRRTALTRPHAGMFHSIVIKPWLRRNGN